MFISAWRVATAAVPLLVGSCLGQERAVVNEGDAAYIVQKILSSGQLSGSLEFSGVWYR